MDTKDKLIGKQKEMIQELLSQCSEVKSTKNERRLYKEIAALEKQVKERKPIEDRSAEITFNDGMDDEEQELKSLTNEEKKKIIKAWHEDKGILIYKSEISDAEIRNKALEIVGFDRLNVQFFNQEIAVNFCTIMARWMRDKLKTK